MKNSIIILPLIAAISLTGCKAMKAIDSTTEMNSKMDKMVTGMDKTNAGINSTNESVRLQKMALALDNMLKEYNTAKLEPVPFGMLPGAKTFSETATADEICEYVFTLTKSIEEFTKEENENEAAFNKKKDIDWNQVIAISGLMPEEKVREIIEIQINQGGRFTETAYVILMARAKFIGMYYNNSLSKQAKIAVEGLQEAFKNLVFLDNILKSSFKAEIKIDIDNTANGMKKAIRESLYNEAGEIGDLSWDPKTNWKKLRTIIKNNYKETSPTIKKDAHKAKVQKILEQVEVNYNYWTK
jgi:hypothetical protein